MITFKGAKPWQVVQDEDLINEDKFPLVHHFDKELVSLIKPNMETGPWIAGGAVLSWYNNEPIGAGDLDVWFNSNIQREAVIDRLKRDGFNKVGNTSKAMSFSKYKSGYDHAKLVQLIQLNFFNSPEEVLNDFDFTVSQLVTDGATLKMGEHTARDIKARVLRMHNIKFNRNYIDRVIKYQTYGYTPLPETMQYIIDNRETLSWDFKKEGNGY